jgi:hypothetical protein
MQTSLWPPDLPWKDGSMTSLGIRVQPWVDTFGSLSTDAWVIRNVESRVELMVDGCTEVRLPRQTQDSVEWLRDRFLAGN